MLQTVLFILACLFLPIAWGVLVNWLFNLWQEKRAERRDGNDDDWIYPDYQI